MARDVQQMPVKYVEHPVSHERVLELRAQGFRILDAKFAPAEEKPKSKTKPKANNKKSEKKAIENNDSIVESEIHSE